MSEPLADYSSLPTYLVSKIARKTNTVMLSGDGGDELFWGYPRFLTFANSAKYFQIPGAINRKVAKKILKTCGSDITGYLSERSLGSANMAFQSYIAPAQILRLTGNYALSEETRKGYEYNSMKRSESLDYLRKNEFYFHLQKILVKVDRMSMANSLEVRVPLLDLKVIEASELLYSNLGKTHKNLKCVLKNELYKYLAPELIEKQKKGFTPPLLVWSLNELKNELIEVLREGKSFGFDQKEIDTLIIGYYNEKKSVSIEKIWTVYVLLKWLKAQNN
jgi:asparagine synthase (glutamine-hydrolysing)